jgi:formate dehydrogenase subunit gamma
MRKRDAAQPVSAPRDLLPPDVSAKVRAALEANRDRPGPLLPVLHAVQDSVGYVPDDAIPLIAYDLNMTRAEVYGVVSFYHHFRTHPPGRHVVRLCRAEACQSLGARALEAHAKKTLGIGFHETTSDGAITLEAVFCLGNCGCGPSMLVDPDTLHARVTPDAFDAIVGGLREEVAK